MRILKRFALVFCAVIVFFNVEVTHAGELLSLKRCSNLKIIDAQKNQDITISSNTFGGKASGLSLLQKNGYQIPTTIFIEATNDLSLIDSDNFENSLYESIQPLAHKGYYNVAIRSSCTNEDTFEDSMAGQFDTIIGKMSFKQVLHNVKRIISKLPKTENKEAKMGVIIQQKIEADYSGVIFSSNPLTYSKKEMLVSFVSGMGAKLVGGKTRGNDVLITVNKGKYKITDDKYAEMSAIILPLAKATKELEKRLNYPVDIEWAVVNSELFFLQCRPIASITKIKTGLYPVNKTNMKLLPKSLISSDKIGLRLKAQAANIMSSNAYVVVHNTCDEKESNDASNNLNLLPKSNYCVGHNVVIVYPSHIKGKIIRNFIGSRSNLHSSSLCCNKFSVHSYPTFKNISDCLNANSHLTNDEYWVTVTLIQEMLDPIYTGIIQKTKEGYLIEVTYGNFITKGVSQTSQYLLDYQGNIISKNEKSQNSWYQIVEGHILHCSYSKGKNVVVSLSSKDIKNIINVFTKVANNSNIILEFGMLKKKNGGGMIPFLMDYVNSEHTPNILGTDINDGIISHGRITGEIVHIANLNTDSIDTHFYDIHKNKKNNDKNTIFFVKKPEVALLKLLNQYPSDKIGFVFQEGSLLSHLSVVLREKGIPALIIGKRFINFSNCHGDVCILDTETPGLTLKKRLLLRKKNSYHVS